MREAPLAGIAVPGNPRAQLKPGTTVLPSLPSLSSLQPRVISLERLSSYWGALGGYLSPEIRLPGGGTFGVESVKICRNLFDTVGCRLAGSKSVLLGLYAVPASTVCDTTVSTCKYQRRHYLSLGEAGKEES
jgi:hypothetical protein